MVSAEDVAKAEGELKAATATIKEAAENRKIAQAELDLAKQTLERAHDQGPVRRDHHQADEASRARASGPTRRSSSSATSTAWPPTPTSRSSTPTASRTGRSSRSSRAPGRARRCPIEKKRFRGKITFVDPEIQPVGETAVRIRAEFENPGWELRPGLDVQMTIFLTPEAAAASTPGRRRRDPDGTGPLRAGRSHIADRGAGAGRHREIGRNERTGHPRSDRFARTPGGP